MERWYNSNLENLIPLWEREVPNRVHKSVAESFRGPDMYITKAPGVQQLVRQGGTLAQDFFSALVLSQRGLKSGV